MYMHAVIVVADHLLMFTVQMKMYLLKSNCYEKSNAPIELLKHHVCRCAGKLGVMKFSFIYNRVG